MSITLQRDIDATTKAAVSSESFVAVPILYLDFYDPIGTTQVAKYFAGSSTDIVLSASSTMPNAAYIGVGGISSISTVEESVELKSQSITAEINGIDSTYIALVLSLLYVGREARLGLITLDSEHNVQGDAIILFKGLMSNLTTSLDSTATITVEINSILADWERPRVKRYNSGTQELIDNSDLGFDNVADLVNKEVIWG